MALDRSGHRCNCNLPRSRTWGGEAGSCQRISAAITQGGGYHDIQRSSGEPLVALCAALEPHLAGEGRQTLASMTGQTCVQSIMCLLVSSVHLVSDGQSMCRPSRDCLSFNKVYLNEECQIQMLVLTSILLGPICLSVFRGRILGTDAPPYIRPATLPEGVVRSKNAP